MAKLDDFISIVKKVGLAKANRYTVILTPPQSALVNGGGDNLKKMLLLCDQFQVPGVNLSTVQNRTFGEFREVPYEKLFGDVQMSFYVDNKLYVKEFFDNWMNIIQNNNNRTFSYYNDYIAHMKVIVEDVADNERFAVEMFECYPKTIAPIQLDYSNKEVMKLSVTMQYKYWKSYPLGEVSVDESLSTGEELDRDYMLPESYYNDFRNYEEEYKSFNDMTG